MLEFVTTVRSLATVSLTFWIFGYLASRFGADGQYIKVPKFLFYLCGAPKSRKLPLGALAPYGAFSQFFGVFFMLTGVTCDFLFVNKGLGGLVSLWISLIGSFVLVLFIRRHQS